MTNKEKFIEIMNQNFNAGLTISNWVQQRDVCTPYGYYKKGACHGYTCDDCQKWWNKEYKEVKMTNKEKFIEIMNQNFNTGLTISNWVQQRDVCTPCGYYKKGACHGYTCDDCQNWWSKEYKEVTQNDD